jgi:ubiquinone/menaquinone biosynthesis C-methylase UbiE
MAEISDSDGSAMPQTSGLVFRWALAYDLLLGVLWRGSEREYRERVVQLAGLGTGESVLDVGCGTGTLAIAAKRRVGPIGRVIGIDASPEMTARARAKAAKAAFDIHFRTAIAEALPFSDATFDAVLSTTVLHCLPGHARRQCISEMVRVLKPGGRLLVVDFGGPVQARRGLMAHLALHRSFDLDDLIPVLRDTALADFQTGALGFSDLRFALARAPMTATPTPEGSGMRRANCD